MPEIPSVPEVAAVLDETSEVRRNADGSVTMSAFGWARHRYTMAFMMAIIASFVFGMVVFLLWKFRSDDDRYAGLLAAQKELQNEIAMIHADKDKTESTAMKLLIALEGRMTLQERKDQNYADAFNGLRADMRSMTIEFQTMRQDLAVIKAQSQKKP